MRISKVEALLRAMAAFQARRSSDYIPDPAQTNSTLIVVDFSPELRERTRRDALTATSGRRRREG